MKTQCQSLSNRPPGRAGPRDLAKDSDFSEPARHCRRRSLRAQAARPQPASATPAEPANSNSPGSGPTRHRGQAAGGALAGQAQVGNRERDSGRAACRAGGPPARRPLPRRPAGNASLSDYSPRTESIWGRRQRRIMISNSDSVRARRRGCPASHGGGAPGRGPGPARACGVPPTARAQAAAQSAPVTRAT